MIKDTNFYNKESSQYSAKRYPKVAQTYVQHFFKKRLSVLLSILDKKYAGKSGLKLLEIGCADGVVLRDIDSRMNGVFSSMIGIDIAPDMIKSAAAMTTSPSISYFVRGQEPSDALYDAVVEVGVANYANFDEELVYAENALKADGRYFLSIAGKGSLNDKLGRGVGYNNFLSYKEYESKISAIFDIEEVYVAGLFIPVIWAIPAMARIINAVTESILDPIAPNLFHEKIYVLKKKQSQGNITQ